MIAPRGVRVGRGDDGERRRPGAWSWLALLVLAATTAVAAPEGPRRLEVQLPAGGVLHWDRGGHPVLVVRPMAGDGWISLARRYCSSASSAAEVRAANGDLEHPLRDRDVRIPMAALRPGLRLAAVQSLFVADRRVQEGWEHWPLDPFGDGEESFEWLAEVFTGRRGHGAALRRATGAPAGASPQRGRPLLIPAGDLLNVFRAVTPVATPTPRPTPSPAPTRPPAAAVTTTPTSQSIVGPLMFSSDERGPYAEYRLRRGEALYSAVVVRFTGQVYAKQVNATAAEIAERSGVGDVTSIPVGYPVKIPLDLLLPRYLPPDHPRRLEWEREQRELGRFLEVVKATDLSGVHVVVDAGHGGVDTGAVVNGMWESTYVYDIACRIKRNLERHTRATVWLTREDAGDGCAIGTEDRLVQDRDQFLLTQPRYDLSDSVIGVHLRWYLTNDIILRRLGNKVPRSKTVFISVHADSLHPSVRGAIVYVPSRYLRPDRYTVKRREIRAYAEYRHHPTVRLGPDFKARVEASSRHLADSIVASLREGHVAVHSEEPVRDHVLRGRSSWVPAVLRYTAAQNAVLVECCNMANSADRALLADHAWRERFARAVVEGVAGAFNGQH